MLTTLAAAAASDDKHGWGYPLALVIATAVFYLATSAHKRWRELKNNPSPTPGQKTLAAVKPQVNRDSDSDLGAPAGGGEVVPLHPRPVEQFVAARAGTQPPTAIVREAAATLKVSESTAWRALRGVGRGRREGGAA
jgi:hypothetical protein